MKRLQFELIKPVDRADIKQYRGFKCAVNNLIKTAKVHPKTRLIEFNYHFLKNSPVSQAHYILEWAVRYAKTKSIEKADKKTFEWAIREGYSRDEIFTLYMAQGVFHNAQHQNLRSLYLITKPVKWYMKFFNKINKWIIKIFQNGK